MPVLNNKNAEIYYEMHGEGPAIVLAHGIGGNHAIWYKQIATFSKSYQVITFDHRGFGNSSDPDDLGRSAFVDDLKALLDHLKIDKAALLGQSMGGGTCVSFAATYPERIATLILADTLHGIAENDDVATIMDDARSKTKDLGQIERVLGAKCREDDPAAEILYGQLCSFNEKNRHTLKGSYPHIVNTDELGKLGFMTMFIAGQDDVLFPSAAIEKTQENVANSFYVEVVGAGHSAFYEKSVEFNDSVLSFLQAAGYRGIRKAAHSNAPGYAKPVSE